MGRYLDYAVIAVYILGMLGIGARFLKHGETTEGYLLGGRRMPYIAVGIACIMAAMSSVSIVSITGEVFNHGATLFVFNLLLAPLGILYYLMFVRFYFKLGSFTPYEYLEYRYDPTIRALVAISVFYCRTIYLGMVLFTTSKIFEGAYHWPAWLTIVLAGMSAMLYTVMGGMKAVVWTDVIQFFVLVIGAGITVITLCLCIRGGAVEAVSCALREGHGTSEFFRAEFYSMSPYPRLLFFLLLYNAVFGPLEAAASDQIAIQRLLSTKNWVEGLKSQIICTVLGMIMVTVLIFIGFAVFTYYHQNPDPQLATLGGDDALFHFIATKLPSPGPGIFMAAMLAAVMSTLSSGFNSMAAIWFKEFHVKFINSSLSPSGEVRVLRWATFLIGLLAIVLGLGLCWSGRWLSQSVVEVTTIFTLLGAATMPAFLFAVLSKRTNSTLIWCYTLLATGEGLSKSVWYILSRKSLQLWEADHAVGFGWAGKQGSEYFLALSGIGLLLVLPVLIPTLRQKLSVKIVALAGMLTLGFAFGIGQWYVFSNVFITDMPQACSFAFGLPIPVLLIIAFIALWFCPKQPREKYQGLTLATLGEKILASPPSK